MTDFLILTDKQNFPIQTSNHRLLIIISTYKGERNFLLPEGNLCTVGYGYIIKDDSSIGNLIISTSSSDTIDNKKNAVISNNGSLTIIWTGIQWNIV